MSVFNTCVASYSFHGLLGEQKCDVFHYLDMLRDRYHVAYADIWTGFLPTLDKDFIGKVRNELDRNGLTLANLCVDGPHVWVDDADQREAHRRKMLEYIEAAKRMGARTIRVDFGGSDDQPMSDEALAYIAETYRLYCGVCQGEGIRIGPENHWGWDRDPENLLKVKEAVNHPCYGHLYHFRNFKGDVEAGEKLAVSYAMHTHVHAGSVSYAKEVLAKLDAAGYTGVCSIEHHSGTLERERVDWQLATIRGILAELKEGDAAAPDYFSEIYRGN